jgi:outer membrane protein OmpA-like peptidoglycan-associated protein
MKRTLGIISLIAIAWLPGLSLRGQERFDRLVGEVTVQPVTDKEPLEIPYITWGGDVATFLANDGLDTKPGSIFANAGLKIKLTPGDDFIKQVRSYLSGQTPFLRGTMQMLGQASEVLGRDPRAKPVVILQLSWSAGDHIVSRENLKTLNDLRRKDRKVKIACQQGGPHVGLLYDSLDAVKINREEVEIVWVRELTGPNGPAEAFRKDPSIDACCVITPDMIGLTGGMEETGSGAEGTVKGAHVLNSTAQMSRSIADVYCVRSDWYKSHRDFVDKFVAGYLKATQELVTMRKEFDQNQQRMSPEYNRILALAQTIFGQSVITSLEVDGHGLLLDCNFVGLPGQIAFFEDRGNLSGFEPMMKRSLDLATGWGYASARFGFDPPGLDYQKIAKLAGVPYVKPAPTEKGFAEGIDFFPSGQLDDRTIFSFTINFEPNESDFSADRYGAEFNRAIQAASTFGNAVVVIRGHADPTKALIDLIKAGMEKGLITRTGKEGDFRYYVEGKQLDLTQTQRVIKLIDTGRFEGRESKPRETVTAALNLSLSRAEAVKKSLVDFAKKQGVNLDTSQVQPAGAGIAEPIVARPTNMAQARENMRVEFRIVRVPAEALNESDFNF